MSTEGIVPKKSMKIKLSLKKKIGTGASLFVPSACDDKRLISENGKRKTSLASSMKRAAHGCIDKTKAKRRKRDPTMNKPTSFEEKRLIQTLLIEMLKKKFPPHLRKCDEESQKKIQGLIDGCDEGVLRELKKVVGFPKATQVRHSKPTPNRVPKCDETLPPHLHECDEKSQKKIQGLIDGCDEGVLRELNKVAGFPKAMEVRHSKASPNLVPKSIHKKHILKDQHSRQPVDACISPSKKLRAAQQKLRFAGTINRTQKVDKVDVAKLKQKVKRLERKRLKDKENVNVEIRAAEISNAHTELKIQREVERKVARDALEKMGKTVDIDDNVKHWMELGNVCGGFPEFNRWWSTDRSGSANPNLLERLGLFLKKDDSDCDDVPMGAREEVEEGEIVSTGAREEVEEGEIV